MGGRGGRRRWAAGALVAAGHAAVLLQTGPPAPSPPPEEAPIPVALVTLPPPPPPEPPKPKLPEPAPPAKAEAAVPRATPMRLPVRRAAPAPDVAPLVVAAGQPSAGEVSDAELAGAAGAGTGAGAGCDMARRLQSALRKDGRIRAAVALAQSGRPVRVWNGDWVRHPGQEGDGLAAVREAIMWEVGFAPEACRREPVQGLVVLSLADGPAAPRVVMGAGAWRWSDLLGRVSSRRSGGR